MKNTLSVAQMRKGAWVGLLRVAVQQYQYGQCHSCFGSSDYHHKQRENFACLRRILAAKSNQIKVGGIEHEFYAHEHQDGMAFYDDKQQPHRKQKRRQIQIIINRYHVA